MRTIVALGIAALLTLAGVVSWVTAAARSNNEANALTTSGSSINPFELMKGSKNLPYHQYDAF
jgi:hypothetical protein